MDRQTYINRLRHIRSRYRRRYVLVGLAPVLCFGVAMALRELVKARFFGLVPAQASQYVLETFIPSFSVSELRRIVDVSNGTPAAVNLLVAVYGLYYVLAVVAAGVLPIGYVFVRRDRSPIGDALLSVVDLKDHLGQPTNMRSWRWHRTVRLQAARLRLATVISPLKEAFVKKPGMQWLSADDVPRELRQAHATLHRFPSALAIASRLRMELSAFVMALGHIEEFLVIASTRETSTDAPAELRRDNERRHLQLFVQAARPLILSTARATRKAPQELARFKVLALGEGVWRSELVRNATGVSLVAAVVMVVGVWLFGIDPSQAFLAWFTVSFGALSVSVGVVSIKLARGSRGGASNETIESGLTKQ